MRAGTLRPGEAGPRMVPAGGPPEDRGLRRDEVRLLVSVDGRHGHHRFTDLPRFLRPGDLLVVNDSAALPASLPAVGEVGPFRLNLATRFDERSWLAEPRWAYDRPGPLPLEPDDTCTVAGLPARFVAPFPGAPRLWFVDIDGARAMARAGTPIRYGHVPRDHPITAYRTCFGRVPGSAEMPSAGRPFTDRVLAGVRSAGASIVSVTLHAGVSSLEPRDVALAPPPEPYRVPRSTADAVNAVRRRGGRVLAVGTTVVRALESASVGGALRPVVGATRLLVGPRRPPRVVDGLLTGLHEPRSTHLELLEGLAGAPAIAAAYRAMSAEDYVWHEFGDMHLILPETAAR